MNKELAFTLLVLIAVLAGLLGRGPTGQASFSVGVSVAPLSVDWDGYTQHTTATPNGSNVTLQANITYYFSDQRAVSTDIAEAFTPAEANIEENSAAIATTRTNHTLNWTGNGTKSAVVAMLVPPPGLNQGTAQEGAAYTLPFNVSATTPLRNSSYTAATPANYKDYVLYELVNNTRIDRTQTFSLNAQEGEATFTNVYFTASILTRQFELTGVRVNERAASGAPSSSGPDDSILSYDVPTELSATRETQTTENMSISNPTVRRWVLELSHDGPESFTLNPSEAVLERDGATQILLRYSPGKNATQTGVTLSVTGGPTNQQFHITLTPQDVLRNVRAEPGNDSVRVAWETDDDQPVVVELIQSDGSVARSARPAPEERAVVFDLAGLPSDTYQACVEILGERRCTVFEHRVESRTEQPGLAGVDTGGGLSTGALVATGLVLLGGLLVFFIRPPTSGLLKALRFKHLLIFLGAGFLTLAALLLGLPTGAAIGVGPVGNGPWFLPLLLAGALAALVIERRAH